MNTENMIEITGVDLVKFVQKVYELSNPQGLGFLHYQEGQLEIEEAERIIDIWKNDERMALGMDYIRGRSCKMDVWKDDNKLWIQNDWYDHTKMELSELLKEVNIKCMI